jgi:hypothetical protein
LFSIGPSSYALGCCRHVASCQAGRTLDKARGRRETFYEFHISARCCKVLSSSFLHLVASWPWAMTVPEDSKVSGGLIILSKAERRLASKHRSHILAALLVEDPTLCLSRMAWPHATPLLPRHGPIGLLCALGGRIMSAMLSGSRLIHKPEA